MKLKRVKFLLSPKPTGDLAMRRKHARRVTPYPSQMQALIDARLMTSDAYEAHRDRRLGEVAEAQQALEAAVREHAPPLRCLFARLWAALVRCFAG